MINNYNGQTLYLSALSSLMIGYSTWTLSLNCCYELNLQELGYSPTDNSWLNYSVLKDYSFKYNSESKVLSLDLSLLIIDLAMQISQVIINTINGKPNDK